MHGTESASLDAARIAPLIWRETDPAKFNAVLNDPGVFEMISVPGDETFDCSAVVAEPRNILLMSEGGGILFCWQEPCIYQFHTSFLPAYHGRHALAVARAARRWMFTHTDAVSLLTKVPAFNRAASLAVRMLGFRREFVRKAAWPSKDGPADLEFYALHFPEWLWLEKGLIESGRAFHAHLDEEYLRHGREPHTHPVDDCHDVIVGAAFEMIRGGQPEKAVVLYNRMAALIGYGLIALRSCDPVILDIGEAVLMLDNESFKVIKCRSRP